MTSIAKKPYIFVIFQGGPDPLSPLWIRAWQTYLQMTKKEHNNWVEGTSDPMVA